MEQKKLRIAQLGSIWETTPPPLYGGTERVVSNLTEGLVNRGHKVTLFATGDSKTRARLISITPEALYRRGISWGNALYPLMHIYNAFEMESEFDLIHIHLNMPTDFIALAFAELIKIPTVITMHFRLPDENEKESDRYMAMKKFSDLNYVSISNDQRTNKNLHYSATVYNGIDFNIYKFSQTGGKELGWIGRFSPDKGAKQAVKVAEQVEKKIILAGKLDANDKNDQKYFQEEIKPKLKNHNHCEYIGEVNDKQKSVFFGQLRCLLNPTSWREPFGLVVVEANACGTPVIAFDNGAMRELIKDGVNGFVIPAGDVAAMAKRAKEIYEMSDDDYSKFRKSSRDFAEKNFSVEKMVESYEKLYNKILKND
ncbi:MAG: glycosyltransferase family 4 protein [Candidatus Berkelbacteria bacterium]|nr:glycosyltransferase family 4 protein [Candidatus Berkelbacteria bacterium]